MLKKILKNFCLLTMFSILCLSCQNNKVVTSNDVDDDSHYDDEFIIVDVDNTNVEKINVEFSIGKSVTQNNVVVEDTKELERKDMKHSIKYYSYMPEEQNNDKDEFEYHDVLMNKRYMSVDKLLKKNEYKWIDKEGVFSKTAPLGFKMSYGIDISKHNGKVDFKKVKNAGFEFVFVRIAYRGYGKKGNLKIDELCEYNLKNAKTSGLKVGAYIFSQAIDEEEAIEEAKFVIDLLKGYKLDLPLVYDPETIKGDIARTDNVSGDQFTKNTIAFCEEVRKAGFTPAVYSNLVWEDYYFDMSKIMDYEIWYADYSSVPQTPYDFKYWQFSDAGLVDGVNGQVDLDVMIENVGDWN